MLISIWDVIWDNDLFHWASVIFLIIPLMIEIVFSLIHGITLPYIVKQLSFYQFS